jgi:ferredoxin
MIKIKVTDREDQQQTIEVPTDINLNLMEVLKGYGYDIMATCGGMALCATCHIHILEGEEKIPEREDAELDMLDTLPDAEANSRLSCQIKISNELDGISIQLKKHNQDF